MVQSPAVDGRIVHSVLTWFSPLSFPLPLLSLSSHPLHSFLCPPSLPMVSAVPVVVVVSVQLRWQAVRLSLHSPRGAHQGLSHLK